MGTLSQRSSEERYYIVKTIICKKAATCASPTARRHDYPPCFSCAQQTHRRWKGQKNQTVFRVILNITSEPCKSDLKKKAKKPSLFHLPNQQSTTLVNTCRYFQTCGFIRRLPCELGLFTSKVTISSRSSIDRA